MISRIVRTSALTAALACGAVGSIAHAMAAPAAATVTHVALHIEVASSKINPDNASLSHARAGQPVRLILYASISDLSQPASASVNMRVTRGGKQVFASRGSFTITRKELGGGSTGTRWFWNVIPPCGGSTGNCLPATAGKYTATAQLKLNGKEYSQTLSFTTS